MTPAATTRPLPLAATHAPRKQYGDYAAMLADPEVEAVIVATSDAFHVPAAIQALESIHGKTSGAEQGQIAEQIAREAATPGFALEPVSFTPTPSPAAPSQAPPIPGLPQWPAARSPPPQRFLASPPAARGNRSAPGA